MNDGARRAYVLVRTDCAGATMPTMTMTDDQIRAAAPLVLDAQELKTWEAIIHPGWEDISMSIDARVRSTKGMKAAHPGISGEELSARDNAAEDAMGGLRFISRGQVRAMMARMIMARSELSTVKASPGHRLHALGDILMEREGKKAIELLASMECTGPFTFSGTVLRRIDATDDEISGGDDLADPPEDGTEWALEVSIVSDNHEDMIAGHTLAAKFVLPGAKTWSAALDAIEKGFRKRAEKEAAAASVDA